MLGNVSFLRFQFGQHSHLVPQVVSCYQKVFATLPWSEWRKCGVCGKSWGLEEERELVGMSFQHCGEAVAEYWTAEQVESDMRAKLSGENSSCWIALADEKVIGFTWGFIVTPEHLESELGVVLPSSISRNACLAYQNEIGIDAEYRNQGIARKLFDHRHQDFVVRGAQIGVVRTRRLPQPSVTYLWFLRSGYEVIAEYPNQDGRVVMAKRFVEQ